MINAEKLKPILEGYKSYLPDHWDDEKYKWEAIKYFQDNWNIDAPNFGKMFAAATEKINLVPGAETVQLDLLNYGIFVSKQ